MRFFRRQRSLWRCVVLSALNLLIVIAANGPGASTKSVSASSNVTYLIKRPSDNRPEGLPVVVAIEASGTVYLDGIPIGPEEYQASFKESMDINNGFHVSLEVEPKTPARIVSEVMSAATLAGAKSMAIVTKFSDATQ